MKFFHISFTSIILAIFLTSCSNTLNSNKKSSNRLTNKKIVQHYKNDKKGPSAAIGKFAGTISNSKLTKALNNYDKYMIEQSSNKGLEFSPSGKSVEWHNPQTDNHGQITPTRTYKSKKSNYCREYVQEVNVGNKREIIHGNACRDSSGKWIIVSKNNQ